MHYKNDVDMYLCLTLQYHRTMCVFVCWFAASYTMYIQRERW